MFSSQQGVQPVVQTTTTTTTPRRCNHNTNTKVVIDQLIPCTTLFPHEHRMSDRTKAQAVYTASTTTSLVLPQSDTDLHAPRIVTIKDDGANGTLGFTAIEHKKERQAIIAAAASGDDIAGGRGCGATSPTTAVINGMNVNTCAIGSSSCYGNSGNNNNSYNDNQSSNHNHVVVGLNVEGNNGISSLTPSHYNHQQQYQKFSQIQNRSSTTSIHKNRSYSVYSDAKGNAVLNKEDKKLFLPRHIIYPPVEALNIVQREFENGDLDEDIVMLRRRNATNPNNTCTGTSIDNTIDVEAQTGPAAGGGNINNNTTSSDVELSSLTPRVDINDDNKTGDNDNTNVNGLYNAFEDNYENENNNNENEENENDDNTDPSSPSYQQQQQQPPIGSTAWLDIYRNMLRSGPKLNVAKATAVAGNDCLSSVLYMSSSIITIAGIYAPIGALLIAMLLWVMKGVYIAPTGLGSDGGAYSVLLNSARKSWAAIAAVLTILSYICTAVVSATESARYLQSVFDFDVKWIFVIVMGILMFFALLSWIGIGESAGVALVIFILHITTLLILIIMTIIKFIFLDGDNRLSILKQNYNYQPQIEINWMKAIAFAYAFAALGCSGFETASNFMSQQRPGVYLKVIRNMHAFCSFFNIIIPICCLLHIDLSIAIPSGDTETILSTLAYNLGGKILQYILCIDAALILCGGVLTSYVGVIGLTSRLAMDRILPRFFLTKNQFRQTQHNIIIIFLILCCSMFILLKGNANSLSATYSIAFMLVMSLFCFGLMLLKWNRTTLLCERPLNWWNSVIGLIGCLLVLFGIILYDTNIILPFLFYFIISFLLLQMILLRYSIMLFIEFIIRSIFSSCYIFDDNNNNSNDDGDGDIFIDPKDTANVIITNIAKQDDDDEEEEEGDDDHGDNKLSKKKQLKKILKQQQQQKNKKKSSSLCNRLINIIQETRHKFIDQQPMVFLTANGNPQILSNAILYIQNNEDCNWVRIVHFFNNPLDIPSDLDRTIRFLNEIYPTIRIDLILVNAAFTPTNLLYISQKLNIPRNFFFMSTPKPGFPWSLNSMGGVRLIAG